MLHNGAAKTRVLVLMYHSVANGAGPTFMPPELFTGQLDALQDSGYHVARLSDLGRWRRGEADFPDRTAILTFDDALGDFAEAAVPPILARNWSATVFVPTSWAGRCSGWRGADDSQRVLDWPELRSLHAAGIDVGSHAETHSDLTKLPLDHASAEISGSKARLEQELGASVNTFAAPYGAVNAAVRGEIARHYEAAVGVKLGRVDAASDVFDLPRVEMHYFRNLSLWRDFLQGGAEGYFAMRQLARSVRSGISRGVMGM